MKSKHDEEEAEKENGERWLLTYSDMITLLLALFIILYAMSSVDLEKFKELSKNLSVAFNNSSGEGTGGGDGTGFGGDGTGFPEFTTSSGNVTVSNTVKSGSDADGTGYGGHAPAPSPLDEIYITLSKYIKDNDLESQIDLENTENYVKVSLKDVVLFVPDSAQMLSQSKPILSEIEQALAGVYSQIDHITISGHTADPSNNKDESSDFAWQLSSDRAVTVLKYMVSSGLPQYKLSIEGYSHFNPVADNATAEGRAKNRRVEITITKNGKTGETTTVTTQAPK